MCDPVSIGLMAGAAALGVGGKLISNNDATNEANREAAARNAVLAQTIAKENGYAGQNATELNHNVASYAPGAQDAQLADAQAKRAATTTGNMTTSNGSDVPLPTDNSVAASDLAKRLLAAHDGAVDRAEKTAKVGGYGDTWLTNALRTNAADRNIGVTNNYAEGTKSILPALQDDAAASVYKPPSIWSTILGGASSLAAGAAGAGVGKGFTMPKVNVSSVWNPIAGVTGQ